MLKTSRLRNQEDSSPRKPSPPFKLGCKLQAGSVHCRSDLGALNKSKFPNLMLMHSFKPRHPVDRVRTNRPLPMIHQQLTEPAQGNFKFQIFDACRVGGTDGSRPSAKGAKAMKNKRQSRGADQREGKIVVETTHRDQFSEGRNEAAQ